MLLAIDIKNKFTDIGIFDEDSLLYSFSISTDKNKSVDEIKLLLKLILVDKNTKPSDITDVIISTVVPELKQTYEKIIESLFAIRPIFISAGIKTGINIKCQNPKDVGTDRIIRAVAASSIYDKDIIIISSSSITTIDFINSNKEFMGGLILPGIDLSLKSLHQESAKLPLVELETAENILGNTTASAIQSGIYKGYRAAVWGLVSEIISEHKLKLSNLKIIIAGESAGVLENNNYKFEQTSFLGLMGLEKIYNLNKKQD